MVAAQRVGCSALMTAVVFDFRLKAEATHWG